MKVMTKSEGIISCSSLSKLDKERHYDGDFKSDILGGSQKGTCSAGTRFLRQDHLYHPSLESDFLEGHDSGEDPCIFAPPKANCKVNLKTVLNGMVPILTDQNRIQGDSRSQQNSSLDISFLSSEKNGDSFLHPSVCIPSAPPLLEMEAINYDAYREVLEAEPPEWLPDSYTAVCMQCTSPFTAITRGRHHCRFCGGVFCRDCTKGRCWLPVKFRERNPQRVCDACYDRLDPLQGILINSISNAMQSAKHDVMDWTCTRGWLNLPVGLSMEYEIYKASSMLRSYCQVQYSVFSLFYQ